MGSRQTVSSELTPQEFHPNCRSDKAALIACDSLTTLGLWRDGSAIILFVGYCEIENCPIFWVGIYRSLPFGRSWHTASHAYAHHNHKKEVFDKWLFGCQWATLSSPHKGKLGKSFLSSHPVARGKVRFWTLSQNFFNFFFEPAESLIDCRFVQAQTHGNFLNRKALHFKQQCL